MHFSILGIQERKDDLEESEEEESASWWFHVEGTGLEKSSVIIISATQVKDLLATLCVMRKRASVSRVLKPRHIPPFLIPTIKNKFPLKT